jgi:hypothetical protein
LGCDGVWPAQVWGAVHMPQVQVPPQPSATVPQFLPEQAVAIGVFVQPHWCGSDGVPPPQVLGIEQLPQV